MSGQAMVERLAGDLPELGVGAHPVAQPSVLDLLGPPQVGQGISLGTDDGTVTSDRRIEVEQGAIGIEHAKFGAGQSSAHELLPRDLLRLGDDRRLTSRGRATPVARPAAKKGGAGWSDAGWAARA